MIPIDPLTKLNNKRISAQAGFRWIVGIKSRVHEFLTPKGKIQNFLVWWVLRTINTGKYTQGSYKECVWHLERVQMNGVFKTSGSWIFWTPVRLKMFILVLLRKINEEFR